MSYRDGGVAGTAGVDRWQACATWLKIAIDDYGRLRPWNIEDDSVQRDHICQSFVSHARQPQRLIMSSRPSRSPFDGRTVVAELVEVTEPEQLTSSSATAQGSLRPADELRGAVRAPGLRRRFAATPAQPLPSRIVTLFAAFPN